MEEIIEHVLYEIKNSGYERKLIMGIVITGGGSMLRHINLLTEYIIGMDARIGYPNEHLSSNSSEELANPIYATGVGLVIKGFERMEEEYQRNPEDATTIKKKKEKTGGGLFSRLRKILEEDVK